MTVPTSVHSDRAGDDDSPARSAPPPLKTSPKTALRIPPSGTRRIKASCGCCRPIRSRSTRSIRRAATSPIRRPQARSLSSTSPVIKARRFSIPPISKNAAKTRPLTFVFNGGPGAASAFLHLGLVGPRVLDFGRTVGTPRERMCATTRIPGLLSRIWC